MHQALEELSAQQWPWEETHTHTWTRGEHVTSVWCVSCGLLSRPRVENPTTPPGRFSMPSEHLLSAGYVPGTLLGTEVTILTLKEHLFLRRI